MYNLSLTEEEVSIILQALSYFSFNSPYITGQTFDIANKITEKIDEIL